MCIARVFGTALDDEDHDRVYQSARIVGIVRLRRVWMEGMTIGPFKVCVVRWGGRMPLET